MVEEKRGMGNGDRNKSRNERGERIGQTRGGVSVRGGIRLMRVIDGR